MSAVTALLQTPVGFLVDRYGARRFLVGGTLLMTLTMATMGLGHPVLANPGAARRVSGIGNSVIHPADYAILTGSIDKKHMGRCFGLHTLSGNLGLAMGPPVAAMLVAAVGWRATPIVVVGLIGIPPRLPPSCCKAAS